MQNNQEHEKPVQDVSELYRQGSFSRFRDELDRLKLEPALRIRINTAEFNPQAISDFLLNKPDQQTREVEVEASDEEQNTLKQLFPEVSKLIKWKIPEK